jgi:hypothetical protein
MPPVRKEGGSADCGRSFAIRTCSAVPMTATEDGSAAPIQHAPQTGEQLWWDVDVPACPARKSC